jgi:hypothetical protein
MMRLPRFGTLSSSVLFAAVMAMPALAQEAPAATETPAATPAATPAPEANKTLDSAVADFWHYGKIARYDLANAEGQRILTAGAEPVKVLEAFEKVVSQREREPAALERWMLRFQGIDPLKDTATQIQKVLQEGSYARRSMPEFIKANIERLSTNERGYTNGLSRLRQSGELSVPFMLDYLKDPSKVQYHTSIRRALVDLGKLGLNPLVAATEMKDPELLITVVRALGDLGYDSAVPYLAKLAADANQPPTVKEVTNLSLAKLSSVPASTLNVADQFHQLGEKFYYGTSSIASDNRNPAAFIWSWDEAKGLIKTDVPHEIYNDLMTMRSTEYALKAAGGTMDSLSLWLAANYKREVQLPAGQTDKTRAEAQPNAHYYGVTAGTQYLNAALARSLKDHDSAVAMKIIASLQEIVGTNNLFQTSSVGPLADAMQYPDRLVRFEAAFAIAQSLPQGDFTGKDAVVPLLGEALSQTGQTSVVVAMPSQDATNATVEALKGAGMTATGAPGAEPAVTAANALSSVDVIIVSEDLGAPEVDRFLQLAGSNAKLQGAAKIIVTKTPASAYAQRATNDSMLSVTQAADAPGLQQAIEAARKKAGSLSLSPETATQYAQRSADLMRKLAIARQGSLDLSQAKPSLLSALDDARPEIVKSAGAVLGLVNVREAQPGLLAKAGDDKTADDVKISLYKSLAQNAKFFGNQLDTAAVEGLSKTVSSAANLDVRNAAAEARGALNLPADQAKTLIVDQAKF